MRCVSLERSNILFLNQQILIKSKHKTIIDIRFQF